VIEKRLVRKRAVELLVGLRE